ncbi:MAG: CBS domain-containing protein [Desulfobacteraceae bacterium]|nr:MAG: CBS domain-containing protein [Desulfobacteraceae bacterium]
MFGKQLRIFQLMGFEVKIDLSWIIIALLVTWSLSVGYFPQKYLNYSTQTYWLMGLAGAAGLFMSIIAHEMAHSVIARGYGIPIRGITLFLFGGVAEMEEEPKGAKDEFVMAVMGPISSGLIAAACYGLFLLGRHVGWPYAVGGVVLYLAMINGLLAVFNLVPAFPLDGGRMLRAALWQIKGNLKWATRVSAGIGFGFGLFLIIYGVFHFITGHFIVGMWWFLIGMFLKNAAEASYQQLITLRTLEGEPLRRFMNTSPVTVPPDLTIDRLVEDYIYTYHHKFFPVVADGRLTGCIATRRIKEIPRDQWPATTVADVAETCNPDNTIGPDADATEALSKMRRTNSGRLMVADHDRLLGIVSLKDMMAFLSLKIELES